ncbi:MAG: DNA gyrase subunit A [Planctomycetota bacterium]|jgi:DNA gyrase subunit A|nr:DNA gyrase subunit A [Planctomycetota bacterium]
MSTNDRIQPALIEEEVKNSYLRYAMSVITSRALPDVRDGLKPSQRRILVAMNDLNLGPRSKHRKCAKICGDTSGNYHPHGESVIYPTLVRLAQNWVLRYPLVHPQGNFGSPAPDPAAAMRYTEARLAAPALDMLEDIEKDTVDYIPNYDETREEPTILPSKLPNLLLNGSSGIAVGMATSIPPHNLCEIADAILATLDNPDITIEELLEIVQGPDFPSYGIICGRHGVAQAYQTGRGKITVRARVEQREDRRGRSQLVVTEIPYLQSINGLIESTVELVKSGRITGIADIIDQTDREGMRIVFLLKRGEDPDIILNQLYKMSPLQQTFSINMIALVDGRPQTLGLKDMLLAYRDWREEVIRRRTQYLLARAEERAHIVEGLVKALDLIDEIIALLKTSPDIPTARTGLMDQFGFSERQADSILAMRLSRLTALEREKLENELRELREKIAEYKSILGDIRRVHEIIRNDISEIRERFGDERRTEISAPIEDIHIEALIPDESVVVTLTKAGYAKRLPESTYRAQGRGGRGVTGASMREGDVIEHLFVAKTHDRLLVFTDQGKAYSLKVYQLPQASRTAKGRPLINLLNLDPDEKVTGLISVRDFDDRFLVMATEQGYIKKTAIKEFEKRLTSGKIALRLEEGDHLIRVRLTGGEEDLLLATRLGRACRFSETKVRPMGRTARGVSAMKLDAEDRIVDMVAVLPDRQLLIACQNGYGKRTPYDHFRTMNRNVKGVRLITNLERNGEVVAMLSASEEEELMMITRAGMIVRTPVSRVSSMGRNAAGVRLIKLEEGDQLVSLAKIPREPLEDEDNLVEAGSESAPPQAPVTP